GAVPLLTRVAMAVWRSARWMPRISGALPGTYLARSPRRPHAASSASAIGRKRQSRRKGTRREAGSGKREAGSGKREAGSGKREAGSGKREAGSGKREAGSGKRDGR